MNREWVYVIFYMVFLIKAEASINATFIENAAAKGAVCLDGSPGAYYFDSGFGDGVDKWIVYLPGGGFCENVYWCLDRLTMESGSTKNLESKDFGAMFDSKQLINPDFYNWNKVCIVYCDGAAFMADVEDVDPETNLHLRGRRIFDSVMEELIVTRGMDRATDALLAGTSAGGLATILNCDRFHSYLPFACRVKCLSDSGFFIHAKDIPGAKYREDYFAKVVEFHELARFLPEACTYTMAPGLCLFPENVVGDVQTPLFLLNSDVDKYQLHLNVKPDPPDDEGWKNCTREVSTIQNCTAKQLQLIKDFQSAFLETLEGVDDNPSRGLFINSCFTHDFVYRIPSWQGIPTLQNMTIAEAFGDWYFERRNVRLIDTQHFYPIYCNGRIS